MKSVEYIKPMKIVLRAIMGCVVALMVSQASIGAAEYDYIDISNPFLRKIPLAVPWFKNISGNQNLDALSVKLPDLLSDTLEFTGYFKMLDRQAFLMDSKNPDILASHINFRNWTAIGAELLITGGILEKDGLMETELRLFDTIKGKLIIGKRYKGGTDDTLRMIRRFCGEVMYHLTGHRGVFDSKIAFLSSLAGKKEIYISEFDGQNPKQFTRHEDITLFPAWSSDGKWMAYTSYAKNQPDLYIRNLTENRVVTLDKKGIQITPAWVPGKFELAATLSFSGDQEIYLLTGGGKIIKRLTNSRGIDVEPTWSPAGKQMAFVSKRSGTPQIYIKDMTSGRVRRLTFQGRYNTQPDWSPKGDKIVYSAMDAGRIDIYTIEVDGGNRVKLTENQGDNEAPSWSPDGSLIVFNSTREGRSKIYIMTAFGTDQRRLISMPGEQTNPKWSPSVISN
jgi:TolB protein